MIIHLDGRALTVADGATVAAAVAASGDDTTRVSCTECGACAVCGWAFARSAG